MLRGLTWGIATLLIAGQSMAQAPVPLELRPGPSLLRAQVRQQPPGAPLAIVSDTARRVAPATYWLELGLIGGTAAGVLLSTFAWHGCTHDDSSASGPCWDNALLGAGFGFAGGFTLGALLGGLMPKAERTPLDTVTPD
jgi:hypothetical protein